MRRWNMISENKPDAWYLDIAKRTFRADLYRDAFASLEREGLVAATDLPEKDLLRYPAEAFIDKQPFNSEQPNAYLQQFAIGKK